MALSGYYQNELMRVDKASQRLREVMDGLSPAFFVGMLTLDGIMTYTNKTSLEVIGLELKDVIGKRFEDTPWWSYSEFYRQKLREAIVRANRGESSRFDLIFQQADGQLLTVDFSLNPVFDVKKNISYLVPSAHDVTERRAAERALTMLRVCNKSLILAQDEEELLKNICQLVVNVGGYRMAWVGYAQHDAAKTIRPMAYDGFVGDFFNKVDVSWNENDLKGQGISGQCIRSGKVVVCRDIQLFEPSKPEFNVVKSLADKKGYRGAMVFPLRNEQRTFGTLVLFSATVLNVSDDEMSLLQELADNLSFGIINLRAHIQRQQVLSAVYKIADGVSLSIGSAFFEKLVLTLTEAVGADVGVIMGGQPSDPELVRTVVAVVDGEVIENFDVKLAGTPCANIKDHHVEWVVPANAVNLYPEAKLLAKLGAEAYIGRQIKNSLNQPIGTLFVLFRRPLENTELASSILRIFTARVAAEMERQEITSH